MIKCSEADDFLLRYYMFLFTVYFKCCLNYFMIIYLIIYYHSLCLRRRRTFVYTRLFTLILVAYRVNINLTELHFR